MVVSSIESTIGYAVMNSIGDPLTIGILLLGFFVLMAALLRLPGEVALILLFPALFWIAGLQLGLNGFQTLILFFAGVIAAIAMLQMVRR